MTEPKSFRWWPGALILLTAVAAWFIVRSLDVAFEQVRSYGFIAIFMGTPLALLAWWVFFSNLGSRPRVAGAVLALLLAVLFRHAGQSGDFLPIIEFRFRPAVKRITSADNARRIPAADFPQLFGPARDCVLDGPELDPDWVSNPPHLVWRQPVGAAWSGFVTAGDRAVTMEQLGDGECVTCYDITSGNQLWKSAAAGEYDTVIAGRGPRATPAIAGGRVFAFGALGMLRCVDLESGREIWKRDLAAEFGVQTPEWGFASSPLVTGGNVIVSIGGEKSLVAFRAEDGQPAWQAGSRPVSYSSPFLLTVAGRAQIVMFNNAAATAHDPETGAVLWEVPWGKGLPHVARPIPVGADRILFSSGYGVGSALYALTPGAGGALAPEQLWRTPRFQAKFSNPVERGGFVYGVSDGFFSCLDLADGKVRWKDGRYGHGQGLMIGAYYLQMTEYPGQLVLLRPTPEAAGELAKFRVFDDKTWNPVALSGDLLLVRNDREAACLRLPVVARP